jgi:hypothetical protein
MCNWHPLDVVPYKRNEKPVNPISPVGGNPIYNQQPALPYVSAGSELAAITGSRGDITQSNLTPQGVAQFDHGRAFGNALRGGTWGFVSNTVNAVVNNLPLAAGTLALGLAFPPLGIAMAGIGAVACVAGVIDKFKQSRELADKADQLLRQDPYNRQQAAAYYRQAEELYYGMGADGTGAITSAVGLRVGANASATRAVNNGLMSVDDANTIKNSGNWFGSGASVKENFASVFRKSEWTESWGYKNASDVMSRWRKPDAQSTVKTDGPDTLPNDAGTNPASLGDDGVTTPNNASTEAPTWQRYLSRNRDAQMARNWIDAELERFNVLVKKAEQGYYKDPALNAKIQEKGLKIARIVDELRSGALSKKDTIPDELVSQMDAFLGYLYDVEARMTNITALHSIARQHPKIEKLLQAVYEFETRDGVQLQRNLGPKNRVETLLNGKLKDPAYRRVWAKDLQEQSTELADGLEKWAKDPNLTFEEQATLQAKAQELKQFGRLHQVVDDFVKARATAEPELNMSAEQNETIGFKPLTGDQLKASPWRALERELERLDVLQDMLKDPDPPSIETDIQSSITKSLEQAKKILDWYLKPNANDTQNSDDLQFILQLRRAIDRHDVADILKQPLADAMPDASVTNAGGIPNVRQVRDMGQQAVQGVQTAVKDSSTYWKGLSAANIAYGNRWWLAPEQPVFQPTQQPATAGQTPGVFQQQPSQIVSSSGNATNEAVGDYGGYVVLNLGTGNYRIYKAPNANRVSKERYDQLPLNERPYYTTADATTSGGTPSSNRTPSTTNPQGSTPSAGNVPATAQWWQSSRTAS